jgi:flagellar assembly protein FliH
MTSCDPFPSIEDLPALDLAILTGGGGAAGAVARARAVEAGRADGFAVGFAEGQVAAVAATRDHVATAVAGLQAAAQDLARRDAARVEELSRGIVGLALAIAETIVGRELDTAVDPGADAIARALAIAPDRGAMVARLHPADAEAITRVDVLGPGRDLAVVADPAVERGGCLLEVGPARIDAQIGTALDRVRDELGRLEPEDVEAMLDAALCDAAQIAPSESGGSVS